MDCQLSGLTHFFEFSHNERTRGHSQKLHKKRVMTDLRQHFFSDRIVNKWNTLSEDIISASSLNNFKGKLQRLHNDGSSTGFFKSAWPSRPSQFLGKLSGKLSPLSFSSCRAKYYDITKVAMWKIDRCRQVNDEPSEWLEGVYRMCVVQKSMTGWHLTRPGNNDGSRGFCKHWNPEHS